MLVTGLKEREKERLADEERVADVKGTESGSPSCVARAPRWVGLPPVVGWLATARGLAQPCCCSGGDGPGGAKTPAPMEHD